jgi:hypothetical protein
MVVVAPLLFILGLVVGNQLQGSGSLTADSISSWLSAIATVAIAVLTFVLAKETWYLREAQLLQLAELKRENIRPNVSVQLERSHVGVHFANVKISNLGKGIARRIQFTFLDREGNTMSEPHNALVEKFLKLGVFRQGIASMGIGQVISSYVLNFPRLHEEMNGLLFKAYLCIHVRFEDVEGNEYTNDHAVDFSQYEGISELGGGDTLYQLAEQIKKIQEHLGKVARQSNGRIGVDVFNAQDRDDEEKEMQAWIEAQRSAQ